MSKKEIFKIQFKDILDFSQSKFKKTYKKNKVVPNC